MSNVTMIRVVYNDGGKESWIEYAPGFQLNINGMEGPVDVLKIGDMVNGNKVTNIAKFED